LAGLADKSGTRRDGLPPQQALATGAVRFLAAMHAPNRFGFGLTYGPPNFSIAGAVAGDRDSSAKLWVLIADALVRIQDHVAVRLLMPADMTEKQAGDIIDAAKLVSGRHCLASFPAAFMVHHTNPPFERDAGKVYEFADIKDIEMALSTCLMCNGNSALGGPGAVERAFFGLSPW
jgi:hypothetical protein